MEFELFHPKDPRFQDFLALYRQRHPGTTLPPVSSKAVCLGAYQHGHLLAMGSLEFVESLPPIPFPVAILGHYEAVDKEAGVALLQEVRSRARERGFAKVLGPMNGSTWYSYRLAMPRQVPVANPPFFVGEPMNAMEYPSYFLKAGYSILDTYQSRSVTQLGRPHPIAMRWSKRQDRLGVVITPLDMRRYDELLGQIFFLSKTTFSQNPYYRPIDFEDFANIMAPLKAFLDPEFVLLAYCDGPYPVGFVFAYPDPFLKGHVILKTLSTSPTARHLGLGLVLVDRIHQRAYAKGYKAVIHALMHDDNASLRISKVFESTLYREYALFCG